MNVAVITTHARPKDFIDCYLAVQAQVDHVVVVQHDTDYIDSALGTDTCTVLDYHEDPPNISRMWNLGLDQANGADLVAVLNDDAIVPPGWFQQVSAGMQRTGASIGSVDQFRLLSNDHLFTSPYPIDLRLRMSGFAFIAKGHLRADEQFHWWFGDDDLEWRARKVGGVVRVAGTPVEHRHPGSTTVGVLADIAHDDRARFEAKWGRLPW